MSSPGVRRLPGTITLDASLAALNEVARYVLALAAEAALSTASTYALRLAADELATNIAVHGYQARPGPLRLEGGMDAERVWVRIEDEAPPFDPREGLREPDLSLDLGDREVGGMGIFLMLRSVTDFTYERINGHNVNTLSVSRCDDTPEGWR